MVKIRSQQANPKKSVSSEEAEALANELSDKPYGQKKPETEPASEVEAIERLTIAMTASLYDELESLAKKRKRAKAEHRSMSAIAREAIKEYLGKHNS